MGNASNSSCKCAAAEGEDVPGDEIGVDTTDGIPPAEHVKFKPYEEKEKDEEEGSPSEKEAESEEFTDAPTRRKSIAQLAAELAPGSDDSDSDASVESFFGGMESNDHLLPAPLALRRATVMRSVSSKAVVEEVQTFLRQRSQASDHTETDNATANSDTAQPKRSDVKRVRQLLKLSETMGIVPSVALQLIVNNPGKLSNFYNLDASLAQTSYGEIRICKVKVTGAQRAVKSISKAAMKEKMPQVKLEIEILKHVDHPNAVMLYEIFEDDLQLHLVTGICSGGNLHSFLLKHGRVKEESHLSAAMRQVMRGVSYLHRNCICHRDLKSEHLLLNQADVPLRENTLKISGFGLSCWCKPKQILTSCVGTASHMAPEVLDRRYNQACDVWSCGVILFGLICGQLPFNVDQAESSRFKFSFNSPAWANVSQEAVGLVMLLLTKSVPERATPVDALEHPWIVMHASGARKVDISAEVLDRLGRYRSENRFKRASLNVAASLISEKEAAASRELFQAIDRNGDGFISRQEMADFGGIGQAAAEVIFRDEHADKSSTEDFTFTEFLAASFDRRKCLTKAVCKTAFSTFDRNGDGSISLAELAHGRLLGKLSAAELQATLEELDKNGDQEIDFQEFMAVMREPMKQSQ